MRRRWGWFGAVIVSVAVIWLVLLPRWSRTPETKAYLERLDAQGIDGGATFYTELPLMRELLKKIEQ